MVAVMVKFSLPTSAFQNHLHRRITLLWHQRLHTASGMSCKMEIKLQELNPLPPEMHWS